MLSRFNTFLCIIASLAAFSSCKTEEAVPAVSSQGIVQIDEANSRTFVQRDLSNQGKIVLVGKSSQNFSSAQVKFKNVMGGKETDWLTLSKEGSNFKGEFILQGGGYYPEVKLLQDTKVLTDTVLSKTPFKVGEVFAVIGHSLAEGQAPYELTDYDKEWCEIVKYSDSNVVGFWGRLANMLKNRYLVPIRIYSTGIGGSTSEQWGKSALGLEFTSGLFDWKKRYPYSFFENRILNDVPKSGLRAVLVLHGENDVTLSIDNIVTYTDAYMKFTRELLKSKDLSFVVARSNRGLNKVEDQHVQEAQNIIIKILPYVYEGANLQTVVGPGFRWDGTHFNYAGLEEAARKWDIIFEPKLFTQMNPVLRSR
ncbi:SGNH/GDSL hydrolase family protein [Aquirufa rosea]|uniref:SGNH/GDSL hydrolase family protein n=1 Tax=Aquirufa rosea TaxID=2509241 RepID=A0A4Q1BXJ5_9BACT|nr:SGNH/GDSL hydrolase family protein [Aquirufa rosea]RXK47126.1 SGNH/GDSL hydrolase family protein [Aquirufa rosea]